MTLVQAAQINKSVGDFVRLEATIKGLLVKGWMPKYFRRTGVPLYWAWAHEFTVVELVRLMAYATDSSSEIDAALSGDDKYDALLFIATNGVESEEFVKRRRVVLAVTMLVALLYSIRAVGFHSLSINELIRKGLDGDNLALRQAVAIDPSVLTMPTVATYVASMQLAGKRAQLSAIYRAAAKGPNRQLEPNWQLRYMERVFAEEHLVESYGRDAVFRLVTQRLKLYDTRGANPMRGLFTTFQRWRESATT